MDTSWKCQVKLHQYRKNLIHSLHVQKYLDRKTWSQTKSSYLIFCGKSFAVNNCLRSWTHRHQQMLCSFPGGALPGLHSFSLLHCSLLQLLLMLTGVSLPLVWSLASGMQLIWIEIRWPTRPLGIFTCELFGVWTNVEMTHSIWWFQRFLVYTFSYLLV